MVVGLANHTLLIARDGTERPIDDSAAPIRNAAGDVAGVVLVFRDVTERRRQEREVQDALAYAEEIIATLREPFLVLDKTLRVKTANAAFYRDLPRLEGGDGGPLPLRPRRRPVGHPRPADAAGGASPGRSSVHDFEVEHDFPAIGRRSMLLNARRFPPEGETRT